MVLCGHTEEGVLPGNPKQPAGVKERPVPPKGIHLLVPREVLLAFLLKACTCRNLQKSKRGCCHGAISTVGIQAPW